MPHVPWLILGMGTGLEGDLHVQCILYLNHV